MIICILNPDELYLVCYRRYLACGDHHVRATRPGVCRPTVVLDCGTHVMMAFQEQRSKKVR
jgi:hypothetical protein